MDVNVIDYQYEILISCVALLSFCLFKYVENKKKANNSSMLTELNELNSELIKSLINYQLIIKQKEKHFSIVASEFHALTGKDNEFCSASFANRMLGIIQGNALHHEQQDLVAIIHNIAGQFPEIFANNDIEIRYNLPEFLFCNTDEQKLNDIVSTLFLGVVLSEKLAKIIGIEAKKSSNYIIIELSSSEVLPETEQIVNGQNATLSVELAPKVIEIYNRLDFDEIFLSDVIIFNRIVNTCLGSSYKVEIDNLPSCNEIPITQDKRDYPAVPTLNSSTNIAFYDYNNAFSSPIESALREQFIVTRITDSLIQPDTIKAINAQVLVIYSSTTVSESCKLHSFIQHLEELSGIPIVWLAENCLYINTLELPTQITIVNDYAGLLSVFNTMETVNKQVKSFKLDKPVIREHKNKNHSPRNLTFLKKLNNYIRSNIAEKITVEGMAKDLYMDRSAFTRKVKRITGLNTQQYILHYRLNEAYKMLENASSVSLVASNLGFGSQNHLSTTFSKHFGITCRERISGKQTGNSEALTSLRDDASIPQNNRLLQFNEKLNEPF